MILSNGAPTVAWPRHPSGALKLDDVTFRDRDHPELDLNPRALQNFPMQAHGAVSAGASARYMVAGGGVGTAFVTDTSNAETMFCNAIECYRLEIVAAPEMDRLIDSLQDDAEEIER